MSIGFPLELNEVFWADYDDRVDKCRGAVCRKAIALHFGIDALAGAKLEAKCGFTTARSGDVFDATGAIRGWSDSGRLPSAMSIKQVLNETDGHVDLTCWLNHVLFEVLRREAPGIKRLNEILEQRTPPVRRILFLEADQRDRVSHHIPDRRTTLHLRNRWDLDAFIAMLCLARRGELIDDHPAHALPAICAFDMFPRVLLRNPSLQFRWERLFHCLHRMFWDRVYLGGAMLDLTFDRMSQNVHRTLSNPRARYRRASGRFLSEEQELKRRMELLHWRRPPAFE